MVEEGKPAPEFELELESDGESGPALVVPGEDGHPRRRNALKSSGKFCELELQHRARGHHRRASPTRERRAFSYCSGVVLSGPP